MPRLDGGLYETCKRTAWNVEININGNNIAKVGA